MLERSVGLLREIMVMVPPGLVSSEPDVQQWLWRVHALLNDYDAQERPEAGAEHQRQHDDYRRTQSRMTPRSRV